jgi:hypothetical protein
VRYWQCRTILLNFRLFLDSTRPTLSVLQPPPLINPRRTALSALKMQPFVYNALPARVLFGFGTSRKVAEEVKRLKCVRPPPSFPFHPVQVDPTL